MRYLIPSVLWVALVLSACGGPQADPTSTTAVPDTTLLSDNAEEILEELEQQREIWAEEGISDYTMTVEIGCFCPPEQQGPFEVTVVDGKLDDVMMGGETADPSNRDFFTVTGLFSTIEEHADADEIDITYSPSGYPTTIDVDPSREIVDEEFRIDVRTLTPNSR